MVWEWNCRSIFSRQDPLGERRYRSVALFVIHKYIAINSRAAHSCASRKSLLGFLSWSKEWDCSSCRKDQRNLEQMASINLMPMPFLFLVFICDSNGNLNIVSQLMNVLVNLVDAFVASRATHYTNILC